MNLGSKTMRAAAVQAMEDVGASLRDAMQGVQSFYTNGGIVKRILSFGSPAPVDVEILGHDLDAGSKLAKNLFASLRSLTDDDGRPLLTDMQISREENYPGSTSRSTGRGQRRSGLLVVPEMLRSVDDESRGRVAVVSHFRISVAARETLSAPFRASTPSASRR